MLFVYKDFIITIVFSLFHVSFNCTNLFIIICLHIKSINDIIWFQEFISNTNLYTIMNSIKYFFIIHII